MYCHCMHHSLLYLTEGEIAKISVDQTLAANDSKTQTISNASSAIGSAVITNVQTAEREVSRIFNVLLADTWIDLHIKSALKSARYSIKDRSSVLFPSLFVRLCKRNHNASISKYAALEKTIPVM